MKETSYFTSTLGQAALLGQHHDYRSIPEFIDHQAEHSPDLPAVGTYIVTSQDEWRTHILSFRQIQHGTRAVAERLQSNLRGSKVQTVALLAPSSLEFLFVWLALMYLGRPVLLIAPQCSASAVAHLCNACEVGTLFRDEQYAKLARDACDQAKDLQAIDMPLNGQEVFSLSETTANVNIERAHVHEHDVAYLHHTSGTSSGVPKPIPQTHRGGHGVLPRLDGSEHATFTTTPLYHGGIADLFRAWTSNALIWLFPGKDVPITAKNVVRCLDLSSAVHADSKSPRTSYFSSVPYVLQMLAADESGLRHLQNMSMIGVGGAALAAEAGNSLVEHGINLVSRFGSAECGFLLSSDRDFASDKDWQYLRHDPKVHQIRFEAAEDGLSELVIRSGWPHMAKTNREDRSFATSDLFEPHDTVPNAWRYHSRADSQLTLVTGKKFDPAPLEAAISSASSVVSDAMIFGEGEAYPGLLLFRSQEAASMPDKDLLDNMRPVVEKLNEEAQSHARISLDMLIPMAPAELEKSSKGTLIRSSLTKRFASTIEAAYRGGEAAQSRNITDDRVAAAILEDVQLLLPSATELDIDSDLFAHGIDSVASMQIRNKLTKLLPAGTKLPLTVVQDSGTIERLAEHVIALTNGKALQDLEHDDITVTMKHLVQQYSRKESTETMNSAPRPLPNGISDSDNMILLTGATGALGSHLLSYLLQHHNRLGISHIYILIRQSNDTNPEQRIKAALDSRSLPVPEPTLFDSLATILPSTLSSPNLGLSPDVYRKISSHITHIYHLAWSVNFLLPLSAYKPHFAGIQNLLRLMAHSKRQPSTTKLIFCSSTASVSSCSQLPIPETSISDPLAAGSTGYARSKCVGEAILTSFTQQHPKLAENVTIVRVGQLSGSSKTGCWNASEAYPLMLSASKDMGVVPDLDGARRDQGVEGGEECAWVPVDVAAEGFAQLGGFDKPPVNGTDQHSADQARAKGQEGVRVLHLLPKPGNHSRWGDIVQSILHIRPDVFRVVPMTEWLAKLEGLKRGADQHPALQLAGFWHEAYTLSQSAANGDQESDQHSPKLAARQIGRQASATSNAPDSSLETNGKPLGHQDEAPSTTSNFAMQHSLSTMPVLASRPSAVHLQEGYIARCWDWITENV